MLKHLNTYLGIGDTDIAVFVVYSNGRIDHRIGKRI